MEQKLVQLRQTLHTYPELSGDEEKTAERIVTFLSDYNPSQIITHIGGTGVAAIYNYDEQGPTIAIRCELDALPIEEENTFEYRSKHKGISHKCGHDGHMTIVAGLASWLKEQRFNNGKVVLLFQPAEETGKGAACMLEDEKFKALNIDYLFPLHNIPGVKMHAAITMDQGFSAEVQSCSIHLTGKECHASEPEQGINPSIAIAQILSKLADLNVKNLEAENWAVLTPVYMNMGDKAYGVSPGGGEIHYTIRTWSTEYMNRLTEQIRKKVIEICTVNGLAYHIDWFEHFPASENDDHCNAIISKAARACELDIIQRDYPFTFGEDFGRFSRYYKTGMFGLGSGLETPALHHSDYDFPDELIVTGMNLFKQIITITMQEA